ncbi:MAG: hypothetical protein IKT79_04630, partial [Akkermansia sp.]|nr:hypothetical protein [Akkermansia sp.]
MSYAHAANDGITFQKDSATNDTTVTVTGGNYADFKMGGTAPHYVSKGAIYGASGDGKVSEYVTEYNNVNLNVSGGTGIGYLIGQSEQCGSKVTGNTNITVSGGEVGTLIGGSLYKTGGTYGFNNIKNTSATANNGVVYWAYKDASDPDINITVTGGTVKQIRGGHTNGSEHVYNSISHALKQNDNGAAYNALMTDKPWAVAGDVNISVGGDAVVGDGKKAIAGAGGSGHSVDGKVTVNVSGGTINGAIYGGSTNIYTEVGSTEVNISGGTINGNVYGGGNYDDGAKKAADFGLDPAVGPTVKGSSTVVLSGGTIDGNVYAAGVKDIVNGGTHVVIKNGGANVTGIISGKGEGATVTGDRLLSIENTGGAGVNWNQIKDFNAVEIKNSHLALGTMNSEFKSVSVEGSHIFGNIDHEVQLNANNSWLQIEGGLTTTKNSSISNTSAPMEVHGNATFTGTSIDNATIVADGDIAFNEDSLFAEDTPLRSSVTNSNLVAGGNMSFMESTMNGGTLSVGGELSIDGATVVVDSINNGDSVQLKGDTSVMVMPGDSDMNEGGFFMRYEPTSLTVNSDLKLAAGSSFKGAGDYFSLAEGINA